MKGLGDGLSRAGLRSNWEVLLVTLPASLILSVLAGGAFYVLVERQLLAVGTSLRPPRRETSRWVKATPAVSP